MLAVTAGLVAALSASGCHPEHRYESTCQLIGVHTVEQDDKGNATLVDVELEWDPCPGDQFQTVRGGTEFAACMKKYKDGDFVPVVVRQYWDTRGFYEWDLEKVGDCVHPIEPDSEGSFEQSQECKESKQYGRTQGFTCSRWPEAHLVKICPWMARE